MSFFESFEEFAQRTGAACSCSPKPWPWDHAPACPAATAHAAWVAGNAALWDRLRSAPGYDPSKIEKIAERFR